MAAEKAVCVQGFLRTYLCRIPLEKGPVTDSIRIILEPVAVERVNGNVARSIQTFVTERIFLHVEHLHQILPETTN